MNPEGYSQHPVFTGIFSGFFLSLLLSGQGENARKASQGQQKRLSLKSSLWSQHPVFMPDFFAPLTGSRSLSKRLASLQAIRGRWSLPKPAGAILEPARGILASLPAGRGSQEV